MRLLFAMDPPAKIVWRTDTTYVLMREAAARGHEVLHCELADLSIETSGPVARVRPALFGALPGFALGAHTEVALDSCDAVLIRRDPPYDLEYYFATLILEEARGRTLIVNDPRGLRDANEKLYALRFPAFIPATIVTRDGAKLRAFQDQQGGDIVVKPLDGCGGMGVFHLRPGDRNRNAILETSTEFGRRWVIGQRYLPAAREGDKRILLLDGQPLGAVLRVPQEDETRGNLHVGGTAIQTTLDARDREICAAVGPELRKDGLFFVGIDVIGGMLTEVNVTSPTGIQEINALDGVKLERTLIDWIEERAPLAAASR